MKSHLSGAWGGGCNGPSWTHMGTGAGAGRAACAYGVGVYVRLAARARQASIAEQSDG